MVTLNKTTSGTLILAGNNTYTGATTITLGTLLDNATSTGQGNYSFGVSAPPPSVVRIIGLAAANTMNITGTSGTFLAVLIPVLLVPTASTLTIQGTSTTVNTLVFGTNSKYIVNINGATADSVAVNGQVPAPATPR